MCSLSVITVLKWDGQRDVFGGWLDSGEVAIRFAGGALGDRGGSPRLFGEAPTAAWRRTS
eukprot:CAMPEP_0174735762 /NCGR_PEP_ID=MMETSP1094-20130205/65523_1 /TAXON_ID=156173 /ORGANISM="Chrysochromulina brevifilum, Strain UTEX LB 985" /LENGTH=59 /DNA_ID=CAMNT_0015938761 /DNA_START=218 /DNA_END=394 /DNA_ORIENTATION=+